jgi:RNA polymerase sigma-70 factor (ECF subfamily)
MAGPPSDINRLFSFTVTESSEAAYKALFGALYPSLFRFAICLLHSREQAEEVASDVMIRLWQGRNEFSAIENIKMYALVMTRNLSLNLIKKNARTRVIPLDDMESETTQYGPTPEQLMVNTQLRSNLQHAIQGLPPRTRLVFKLIKEDGLSYKQVSELLNISVRTVDAHLVSAMRKLMQALKVKFDRA